MIASQSVKADHDPYTESAVAHADALQGSRASSQRRVIVCQSAASTPVGRLPIGRLPCLSYVFELPAQLLRDPALAAEKTHFDGKTWVTSRVTRR